MHSILTALFQQSTRGTANKQSSYQMIIFARLTKLIH